MSIKSSRKIFLTGVIVSILFLSAILGFIALKKHTSKEIVETIVVDGLKRSTIIYLPKNYSIKQHLPLVIALHGGGGSGKAMIKLTREGFNKLADEEGFVVAYPNGVERHWNDGRNLTRYYAHRENVDDVGFISMLIDYLSQKYNIDTSRVYVTGMSNGALMAFRLALELSNKISAVAAVAGSMPVNLLEKYSPDNQVSILMINGLEDPLVPWEGGYIHVGGLKLGEILSIPDTVRYWVIHNNCSIYIDKTYLPDIDDEDESRVWVEQFINPETGAEVILYGVEGGGHTWPNGYQYLPENIIGKTNRDIDACKVIWDFFKRH